MLKDYPIYINNNINEHEQDSLLVLVVSKGESVFLIEGKKCRVMQGDAAVIFPGCNYEILSNNDGITGLALYGKLILTYKGYAKCLFLQNADLLVDRYLNLKSLYSEKSRELSVLAYTCFAEILDNAVDYIPKGEKIPLIVETAIEIMRADSSVLYNVDEIAQQIGVSLPYLSREFKKYTGIAPSEYLKKIRIENAKSMLGDLSVSITMVGSICGFSGVDYFSRVFKQEVGLTPSQYRKSISANKRNISRKSAIPDEAYL